MGGTQGENANTAGSVNDVLKAFENGAWHSFVFVSLLDPADKVAILKEGAKGILLAIESVA